MTDAATLCRVLVVDDEPNIADTLALILRRNGFDVDVAYGGQEALLSASTVQPAIVLADCWLRDMDGIETARLLREIAPSCRIFMLSGQPDTSPLMKAAKESGHFSDILFKPIHPDILVNRMRSFC